jgi:hypothetical protein
MRIGDNEILRLPVEFSTVLFHECNNKFKPNVCLWILKYIFSWMCVLTPGYYHTYSSSVLLDICCLSLLFMLKLVCCILMHTAKQIVSTYIASSLVFCTVFFSWFFGSLLLEQTIIFLYAVPSLIFNHLLLNKSPLPVSVFVYIARVYVSSCFLLYIPPNFQNIKLKHVTSNRFLSYILQYRV